MVQHRHGVVQDLGLVGQRWRNGHAAVGDKKQLRLCWHIVTGEHVELPPRAQADFLVEHRAQKVAGIHLTLDEDVRLAGADELHGAQAEPVGILFVHDRDGFRPQALLGEQHIEHILIADENHVAQLHIRDGLGNVNHLFICRRSNGDHPLGAALLCRGDNILKFLIHVVYSFALWYLCAGSLPPSTRSTPSASASISLAPGTTVTGARKATRSRTRSVSIRE